MKSAGFVLLMSASAFANIVYPAASPAPGAQRENEGRQPSDAEKMALGKIIDCVTGLGMVTGLDGVTSDLPKCARCLKTMLDNGRMCIETGTANATPAAATFNGRDVP